MSLATLMDADIATVFLNTDDFAVAATIGAATVNGILDLPFNEVDQFGRKVENAAVSFVAKWSELSGVAQGDTVVIAGTTYYAVGAPEQSADQRTARVKLSLSAQHG